MTTTQNASLIIDHFLHFTNNDNDNDNKKTSNKRHKITNEIKTGKRIMLRILTNQCPGGGDEGRAVISSKREMGVCRCMEFG